MELPSTTTLPARPQQTQQCPATRALERQSAAERRSLESFEHAHPWFLEDESPRQRCNTDYALSSDLFTKCLMHDLDGSFPPIEWDPSADLPSKALDRRRRDEEARRRLLFFRRPRANPQLQRSPECPDTTCLLDFASSCLQ